MLGSNRLIDTSLTFSHYPGALHRIALESLNPTDPIDDLTRLCTPFTLRFWFVAFIVLRRFRVTMRFLHLFNQADQYLRFLFFVYQLHPRQNGLFSIMLGFLVCVDKLLAKFRDYFGLLRARISHASGILPFMPAIVQLINPSARLTGSR